MDKFNSMWWINEVSRSQTITRRLNSAFLERWHALYSLHL